MRQAAAKTNDLAGDGTTTSVVLAQGLITEGVKVYVFSVHGCSCRVSRNYHHVATLPSVQVVAAGSNPVLITRGIEKTTKALVQELKAMSKEVFLQIFNLICFFATFHETCLL